MLIKAWCEICYEFYIKFKCQGHTGSVDVKDRLSRGDSLLRKKISNENVKGKKKKLWPDLEATFSLFKFSIEIKG